MPFPSRAQARIKAVAALQTLSGPGVHGGLPCRLELRLRAAEAAGPAGPRFRFPGFSEPLSPEDLFRLPRSARHATVLGPRGNAHATIGTPEHLLAALLFHPGAPLDVVSDAAELPGLDGSALPYREALARLMPEAVPRWNEYPCDLSWDHAWGDGHLRVRPSDRFRVRYALERGPLKQAAEIEDAATAYAEILPARTFAFHAEWEEASARGLMAGDGPGSGLLLAGSEAEWTALRGLHPEWGTAPFPLLHPSAWRLPEEPVRHKILDLLGDLALKGLALPRVSIEIRNGGHHAHHALLARLAEY